MGSWALLLGFRLVSGVGALSLWAGCRALTHMLRSGLGRLRHPVASVLVARGLRRPLLHGGGDGETPAGGHRLVGLGGAPVCRGSPGLHLGPVLPHPDAGPYPEQGQDEERHFSPSFHNITTTLGFLSHGLAHHLFEAGYGLVEGSYLSVIFHLVVQEGLDVIQKRKEVHGAHLVARHGAF